MANAVGAAICPPQSLEEKAAESGLVFVGSVESVEDVGSDARGRTRYIATLNAIETIKGQTNRPSVVLNVSGGWFAPAYFPGSEYLVFTSSNVFDDTASVSSCNVVRLMSRPEVENDGYQFRDYQQQAQWLKRLQELHSN